jgi:hypothetical protein
MTYDVNPKISVSLSPRFLHRTTVNKNNYLNLNEKSSSNYSAIVATLGIKWFLVEYGLMKPNSTPKNPVNSSAIQQISVGITTMWDDVDR